MLSGIEGQHSNPSSTLTPTSRQHPRVNDRSPLGRRRCRAVVVVRRAFCLLNTRSSSSLSSPPPPTSSRPPRKSARPRRSAPSAGRTADGTDDRRTDGGTEGRSGRRSRGRSRLDRYRPIRRSRRASCRLLHWVRGGADRTLHERAFCMNRLTLPKWIRKVFV